MPNLAWINVWAWVQEPQEFPTLVIFAWLCVVIHSSICWSQWNLARQSMHWGRHLRAKFGPDRGWGVGTVAPKMKIWQNAQFSAVFLACLFKLQLAARVGNLGQKLSASLSSFLALYTTNLALTQFVNNFQMNLCCVTTGSKPLWIAVVLWLRFLVVLYYVSHCGAMEIVFVCVFT